MKIIKDPIYGYIQIENEFLPIIDSPNFQRLRNIIQTSYTAVYPSSLHNRFAHSLGVYHLGNIAFESLINNSSELIKHISQKDVQEIKKTFLFACLCHDLGHSPFSHTGEKFYPLKKISRDLENLVGDNSYSDNLKEKGGIVGKEHEIMSALLSLKVFKGFIDQKNYDFFSRAIIGLKYNNRDEVKTKLLNACIELLNSQIIDIDKLDYLIRDSYMSGYNSVSIDYIRLLGGVTLSIYCNSLCYKMSSLSILESVLNAHDMERRWLQSHPMVLYESYLIKRIITDVDKQFIKGVASPRYDTTLLNYDSLTEKGTNLPGIGKLKFICDADILFLAKLKYRKNSAIFEYINRGARRHPIWKSEEEFRQLLGIYPYTQISDILMGFEADLLSGEYETYSINKEFEDKIIKEKRKVDKLVKSKKYKYLKDMFVARQKLLNKQLHIVSSLKNICGMQGIPFDLIVIFQQWFKKNELKDSFKNLRISLPNIDEPVALSEISANILDLDGIKSDSSKKRSYFYLYYIKDESNPINVSNFCTELGVSIAALGKVN